MNSHNLPENGLNLVVLIKIYLAPSDKISRRQGLFHLIFLY